MEETRGGRASLDALICFSVVIFRMRVRDPRRVVICRSVDSEIIREDGWIAKENNRESLFEDIGEYGFWGSVWWVCLAAVAARVDLSRVQGWDLC